MLYSGHPAKMDLFQKKKSEMSEVGGYSWIDNRLVYIRLRNNTVGNHKKQNS